jgi:biopolymer transport protein TolR
MAFSPNNSSRQTMADINVTPLVDVMLVLLIIFMVTAPMLNNAGLEIDLPKAELPALDMNDDEQLILTMRPDRRVQINDQATLFELEEIGPRLRSIAEANPDRAVFVRADGGLPYRDLMRLLELARKSGMPRVGLVTDPTGAQSIEGASGDELPEEDPAP